MVLLVNNRFLPVSPTNLAEFYNQNPRILQGAKDLAEKKPLRLEPTGILYVRQKQWAATHPGDQLDDGQVGARGDCYDSQLAEWLHLFQNVVGCGTEDVLTCHVIILREPSLGVTAIAHFDEFSRRKDFECLMKDFLEKVKLTKETKEWDYCDGEEDDWEWEEEEEEESKESHVELDPATVYEVHLIGGYADDAKRGHKLSQRFFKHLHDLAIRLEIKTCCLGTPNTKKADGKTQPIISGVHINIHTGKISPVLFNRTFTDFTDNIRNVLLIFPPLIKNKSSLKKMIAKQEDRGFAGTKGIRGYDTEVRCYWY